MKIPGFPGMPNMDQIMQQAQAQQEQMRQTLEKEKFVATSGGGVVSVTIDGSKKMLAIEIDESLFKDGDREMLQDLIKVANNAAQAKADEYLQRYLSNMMGQMGLGGF
ncbi:MAG: YbaB/EbfC family nucleoid-associated protein [Blastocatellia bacterium]|nr:YbaB/EbfC family nucleoid-associated protein [Blastocatellia bacterium]